MSEYHNIYFPLLDVYEAGGPTTFTDLSAKDKGKKNLIVMNDKILESLRSQERKGSQSAFDIGEYMRINFRTPLELKHGSARGFKINQSLDVVVLSTDDTTLQKRISFDADDIQKKVTALKLSADDKVDFLTTNNYDATEIRSRSLRQSRPKFLMANAEIVKKGIITANNEFKQAIFSNNNSLSLDEANQYFDDTLYPNQFIDLGEGRYARVKVTLDRTGENNLFIRGIKETVVEVLPAENMNRKIKVGSLYMKDVLGVTPRSMEQYLALQYCLFDPDITTSFISGGQGSGKTLLAYAASVDLMLRYNKEQRVQRLHGRSTDRKPEDNKGLFDSLILMKPLSLAGDDEIGFLPGRLEDKLGPFLDPFRDAHKETKLPQMGYSSLESLFSTSLEDQEEPPEKKKGFPERKFPKDFPANPPVPGTLETTFYGMSRGRSFRNALIVIDEAQNMKPYMMKTLIERLGLGSKLVILGDPYQVDASSGCTPDINGLTHSYKHLISQPFTAGIHLVGHHRSHDSSAVRSWRVYK